MKLTSFLSAALTLFLGFTGATTAKAAPTPIAIAAAGDLRGVLEELKATYEGKHPDVQLLLSFGASGSLTMQIQQGAPFDIFLAADTGFPEFLQKDGLVTADGLFPYATGRLTLWVRKDLNLDPAKDGLKVLLQPSVKRISTANPKTAPYGRAGEAALRHAGLYDAVQPRLVFADNIAQAAMFLQAGTADAGLISFSQADNPVLKQSGVLWVVPADTYPSLRQAGVILKRTKSLDQAKGFMAFLVGPDGQSFLARHGFAKP
jgi:molybdate transport system substrate-binding protein